MEKSIKEKFNQVAKRVANEFGVVIHLAEINGKRWSYIGGDDIPENLAFDTHCLKISDSIGTIVYGWSNLDKKREKDLLSYCQQELIDL
jgi:hypothetical protein